MTDVGKHPWLMKRNGTFYVRAPVPKDIQKSFGKREVTYSLRTKCPKQAGEKVRIEAAQIPEDFEAHRAHSKNSQQQCADKTERARLPLTAHVIQQVCDEYYQDIVDRDFQWRGNVTKQARADDEGFRDDKYITHPESEWYHTYYADLTQDEKLTCCFEEHTRRRIDELEQALTLGIASSHEEIAREVLKERAVEVTQRDLNKLAQDHGSGARRLGGRPKPRLVAIRRDPQSLPRTTQIPNK